MKSQYAILIEETNKIIRLTEEIEAMEMTVPDQGPMEVELEATASAVSLDRLKDIRDEFFIKMKPHNEKILGIIVGDNDEKAEKLVTVLQKKIDDANKKMDAIIIPATEIQKRGGSMDDPDAFEKILASRIPDAITLFPNLRKEQ